MDSNKTKIRESVKELLHNPHFILWCYNPTEESEIWWNGWIENHPERKDDIFKARTIVLSTRMNQIPFPEEDYNRLYSRIKNSADKKKRIKSRKHIFYSISAACIACIIFYAVWHSYIDKHPETIDVTNILAQTDSIQTEIELEVAGQEKLVVSNKATIKLDDKGTIHIKDEEVTTTNNPVPKEEQSFATNTNILKVPRGRHTKILLSDGSKVWVNSETVLHFPTVFDSAHRTIFADGEIYLEVAKDESRPFYVQTSQMNIRVLGTSFNVTAYKDDSNQSVVLKEGLVEINTSNGIKQNIRPNDRLVLENNQINISKVDPYNYISWIDGVFILDKQPLKNIAQRLSRYYKVNIICAPEVENYKSTGKLVLFEDINKVLYTLEEMFPIKSSIEGDTIKININLKN